MSQRNFPCFLTAYESYAKDGFCPDIFHEWVGRSVLAGAIERKITLKQNKTHHVPNLYVMLVSHPAVGKSTAIERGVDLLEEMKIKYKTSFRIAPNQITEPALIDLVKETEFFPLPTNPNISLPQSPGYFYASEASASALNNTFGDFIATMTAFYDSPPKFRKKIKMEAREVVIQNVCMNLLAGATFEYLNRLINEKTVLGGFASRLLYIVVDDRPERQADFYGTDEKDIDLDVRDKLVQDLAHINKLVGPMKPTKDWLDLWKVWFPKFDSYIRDLGSARMESIMGRKSTNLIKLSMLLSISESDSLIMNGGHFERALQIIETAYKDNPLIIATAMMTDKGSQEGVSQKLMRAFQQQGLREIKLKQLKTQLIMQGTEPQMLVRLVDSLIEGGLFLYDIDKGTVSLAPGVNPDSYL